jgi:SAM-dependent methyltransferase
MARPDQDITEHQRQIEENLRHWQAKPVLREIYRDFHQLLAGYLSNVPGETVEIGSGIGNIKEVIPNCVRTDIFPNPWNDRQENIYRLSMADCSVANLILFDVFHHLEYPLDALDECHRVLNRGGRLLVFDHAMSVAGFLFSKFVHHERSGFARQFRLRAKDSSRLCAPRYYADHANAWRILDRKFCNFPESQWSKVAVVKIPAIKWLLSGGYRGPSLLHPSFLSAATFAERLLSAAPFLCSLRLLVVLEKKQQTLADDWCPKQGAG